MKKGIIAIMVAAFFMLAGTGCVKRVETMDHGKKVLVPEKALPAKEKAVAVENKVEETKKKLEEKKAILEQKKKALEEAKKNKADLKKYELIKESKGKLW